MDSSESELMISAVTLDWGYSFFKPCYTVEFDCYCEEPEDF